MDDKLQQAVEIDIKTPAGINKKLFEDGYLHSINGGQLTERDHLKRSFMEGFRAGRLYLKELRKSQNIIEFSSKHHFKITSNTK